MHYLYTECSSTNKLFNIKGSVTSGLQVAVITEQFSCELTDSKLDK